VGALGVVVLIDNSRPDPLADLHEYLDAFRDTVASSRAVIGIGRTETHPDPRPEAYYELADRHGVCVPILSVDVRQREDVLLLLNVLFSQIEASLATDAQGAQP
jgi:signal recognition particle receptor subunit beta